MRIAEAYVEIKGDYKMFRSELSKEGKSAGQQVAGAFASAFAAAAFTGGIAKSIGAANRLQQAVGATEAVFGSAGKAVEDFAETSAKSFGISEAAARELTSQIGALLQGMGFTAEQAAATSVDIAKLGADLAATFGGKPEEAVLALGAALRGERDPIERYGISLNEAAVKQKALEMGLYDGVGALDANGKAQATLALITERSAGAQGQFAREAGTAAGQQAIAAASAEDAAASFGEVLLPVYTRVVEVVGKLAQVFGGLPAPVQTAIVALVGLAALQGPIRGLVGQAKALEGALGKVGLTSKSAGIAFGLLTAALITYELRQNAVKSKTEELARLLDGQFKQAVLDSARAWDSYKPGIKDEILSLGQAAGFTAEEILKMVAPTAELQARLLQLAESDGQFRLSLEETGITLELLRTIVGDNAAAQAQYEATMATTTTATEDLTAATDDTTSSIEALAERLAEAKEQTDALAAAAIDGTNAQISYEDATWNAAVALEEYSAAMAAGNLTLEEGRALFESTRDALLDQAEAFVEANGATLDSEAGARLYQEELGRLASTLQPGSPLRVFLDEYIASLDRIPSSITTTVRINQEGGVDINGDGRIDAKALGGPVAGGVPVLVGEKGPEVFVPSVPGQIIPNNQLKTGGSSLTAATVESGVGGQVGASGGGMSAEQFGREAARAMARELRVLMRVG